MIVVTGATGTVGSRLVERLLAREEPVRVFCRDLDKARRLFGDRPQLARGDYTDPDSIDRALDGADRVFLLAAAPVPGAQVEHERAVIAASVRAGIRRLVKLSVAGAHEHAPTHYSRWHRQVEQDLEVSGLDHTILRPAGFMQNLLEWAAEGSFHTCAEDGRAALVDARDIADVAAAVLTEDGHGGRAYTLTGPASVSYDEVAAALSRATGRQVTHVRVPQAALVQALLGAGLPSWLAEDLAAQFRVYATGRTGHGGETTDDVATVLGRPPRSVAAFAREEFAAAMKDHG